MRTRHARFALSASLLLALVAPAAHAQFAVIDIAAVNQLVSQVQQLEQQLATARSQLTQAQAEYQAMTGSRGMQSLLGGTVRNYLPSDWATVQGTLKGAGGAAGAYPALAADLTRAVGANAILTAPQLAALPAPAGQALQAGRESAALLAALTHEALANSSQRFASLQQLIDTIGSANDQKSILELGARIAAEGGMLENEHTKLEGLYQSTQAEEWLNAQRTRELIVAGHGQFAGRFQPHP
ncbi:MAG TPA: type IV secretion system protein [Steroidobacteraceae bacterium]|nr:type IV secretion system protein [Steroidobacteraceae bacterium]